MEKYIDDINNDKYVKDIKLEIIPKDANLVIPAVIGIAGCGKTAVFKRPKHGCSMCTLVITPYKAQKNNITTTFIKAIKFLSKASRDRIKLLKMC